MLAANHLSYSVNNKLVLDDVTVTFEPGKLNLIIGPNGAGKSTLVKILCNQLHPQKGTIYYGNRAINEISIEEFAKFRAVLSQNIELAFPLKVSEVVMMGRYPHFNTVPTSIDTAACDEAMHFFDVTDLADQNYLTLSGGEKQRVQFARVLAQIWFPKPDQQRYLILDEPLTFLDVRYQFQFMNKLLELCKNKDLIVIGVVHDLNLVSRFADVVILLKQGKLLAHGDQQTVLTKANIKAAYELDPVIHLKDNRQYIFFE